MELFGAPLAGLAALVAGSYLFGAIPTAYLAARITRGVDIRRVGSGNVGGANAIRAAGRPVGLAVIAFDVFAKGPLPVVAAVPWLGYDEGAGALAATAALIGHDWSVFLRFYGGRGLGNGSGAMLAMAWEAWVSFAALGLAVWLVTRNSPVAWAVAIPALPVIAIAFGASGEYVGYAAAFALISAVKRIASNPGGRRAPPGTSAARLYWNRLVYDRDVRDRDAWLRGGPERRS